METLLDVSRSENLAFENIVFELATGTAVTVRDSSAVNFANVVVQAPNAANALTAMLAMDVSGSMAEQGKILEAKQAARLFLERLNARLRMVDRRWAQ